MPRKSSSPVIRLLRWLTDPDDEQSLAGDIEEEYWDICQRRGEIIGRLWIWFQIIASIPSFIKCNVYWRKTMLLNHFKVAWRNLTKHKAFSFINISGLAIGMACCVLILLWTKDELSYDRFNVHHTRLFRTVVKQEGNWWTSSPWALARVLKNDFPEIEKASRYAAENFLITYQGASHFEPVALVDQDFLEMFTFPLIKGDPRTVFSTLESAVINEKTAKKYFGNEDPIGKAITLGDRFKLTVTGLVKDGPANSHMDFNVLAQVRLYGEDIETDWSYESATYVLVKKDTALDELRNKISGVVMKYDKRVTQERILDLEPITRIHLYSLSGGGPILSVYIFSTIAVFILLIACINFMNLSTARSAARAKEVGLRKTLGAQRSDIIRQHYGESILMSFIALLLAVVLVILLLPAFNNLAQKTLKLDVGGNLSFLLGLVGIALFTGLVSGSYPALFLSALDPIKIVTGTGVKGKRSPVLRKVLVVSQFAVAIILIIGTIMASRQMSYIRNKDLGFNRENILVLSHRGIRQNYEAFKDEVLKDSGVVEVTAANNAPTFVGNINPVFWEGGGPEKYMTMNFIATDHDYIKTFGMEIVKGRDFSREFSSDAQNYIINEAAAKLMGFENPVGKLFSLWENRGQVIGVVKNFHSRPLHTEIPPLVITLNKNWAPSAVFIRIRPDHIPRTIESLRDIWKKFAGHFPFEYRFLDEAFDELYRSDQRTGTIFKYFSLLAVVISCLGIFGLAAYMAEQRTREIGIRKVLGATSSGIMMLVSGEFLILLGLANAVALPVGYFLMKKWLQGYAYRTEITVWVFLLAGLSTVVIALATVSLEAFRASRTDPSRALRYE